jgi:hypothetical protein
MLARGILETVDFLRGQVFPLPQIGVPRPARLEEAVAAYRVAEETLEALEARGCSVINPAAGTLKVDSTYR